MPNSPIFSGFMAEASRHIAVQQGRDENAAWDRPRVAPEVKSILSGASCR